VKQARQNLEGHGHCLLPAPLSIEAIEGLCAALGAWRDGAPGHDSAYGILHNNIWQTLDPFRDAIRHSSLGPLAAALLGEPVTLFQDNLIWKTPGTTERVQWHQDYAYWPLSAPRGVTFWLALDDADDDNGCLRYIPGTHALGERQPTNFITPGDASWRQDLPPLSWEAREHQAISAPARAGTLLAHHPLTWHMSPPNPSARHRRAWSMTWITDDVCWDIGHAPHPYSYFLRPTDGTPPRGDLFPRFG
jgi:phytanoyl-CoA hydroxylase